MFLGTQSSEFTPPGKIFLKVLRKYNHSPVFSYCTRAHAFPEGSELHLKTRRALPELFTSSVICVGKSHHSCDLVMVLISNSQIGDDFDGFGSCKGDSGGPVIRFNSEREHFEQIAVVQGGIGA